MMDSNPKSKIRFINVENGDEVDILKCSTNGAVLGNENNKMKG